VSETKSPLSRWSQRKLAARRGDAVDEPVAEVPSVDAPPPPAAPTVEPEAPVLPPIDTLDFQSDYTVFLAKNVPEALHRAALRKLWASDPVFAILDGLNDYDEDYHLVDTTITAAQTAYQAGRGYIDAVEKKLERIDEATGGTGDASPDSQGEAAPAGRAAGEGALSDNVAAAGEGADVTRQSAAHEPGPACAEPAKKPSK
jgi:hypothetical protein